MDKHLPSRPDLDHLRQQAKTLLAALKAGDPGALATFREHLPAAKAMSAAQIKTATLRLTDAQSAVARQYGFDSWPKLRRHVEQLRALQGTWGFAALEIDGSPMPAASLLRMSNLVIDGDRFHVEFPDATHGGALVIDTEPDPHHIELKFTKGPEAGRSNFGIYRLAGDEFVICLDMNGNAAPPEFSTAPGTGRALETLRRVGADGRIAPQAGAPSAKVRPLPTSDPADFPYVPSPTLTRLQGEWLAEELVKDGITAPPPLLAIGRRTLKDNELKIRYGPQLIIHALVRVDDTTTPLRIDYHHLTGPTKGATQHGILEWRGDSVRSNIADYGQPHPPDFTCPPGSGRTLSQWRPARE